MLCIMRSMMKDPFGIGNGDGTGEDDRTGI